MKGWPKRKVRGDTRYRAIIIGLTVRTLLWRGNRVAGSVMRNYSRFQLARNHYRTLDQQEEDHHA